MTATPCTPDAGLLGRHVDYPRGYDNTLLFAIPRASGRSGIGLHEARLPFVGLDRWHAYELGWLDRRGKPCVATATLEVPADSPNLVESKSLKLYLNSFNATRFDDPEAVRARMVQDLSRTAGARVSLRFGVPPAELAQAGDDAGQSLDALELEIDHYGPPRPDYLAASPDETATETLCSALLKSNCPVTGQPDWASVLIGYHGPRIDRAGLLRYLVSFRDHAEFHEQCVERIFADIQQRTQPRWLWVEARYTRRGGLDINPWRASPGRAPPSWARDARQ
ncbi:MAG: NADPH-dependent 7-cyano-7-deazaguanine reductase QueF [Pseudomonadota bacterium]|nr:NADPH-dependent 7-cyano-7-deazaguanine reductase QueF [Pseudomonadota bacterium]